MASQTLCAIDVALDSAIKATLSVLKDDFFLAIQEGATAVTRFNNSWNDFSDLVISSRDRLEAETVSLVYYFSLTRDIVENALSDLQSNCMNIFDEFSNDINMILSDGGEQLFIEDSVLESIAATPSAPSYNALAAHWLIDNIHNPYPSITVRNSLSTKTGTPRKDIDGWFVDARKKIGWNDMRKRAFSNRRADIVDAATRFFIKQDTSVAMEPKLENEFIKMEARAQAVYSKYNESHLAAQLDKAVKDTTPELKQSVLGARQASAEGVSRARGRIAIAYPTPERSPGSYSTLSLPSPSSSVLDLAVPENGHSKRKRKEFGQENYEVDEEHREAKRTRFLDSGNIIPGLPSPSLSSAGDLEDVSEVASVLSPTVSPTRALKRALPETGGPPCKQLRFDPDERQNCPSAPTTPMTPTPDGWLQILFNSSSDWSAIAPPPVSVELRNDEPLEIELFNFSSHPTLNISTSSHNTNIWDAYGNQGNAQAFEGLSNLPGFSDFEPLHWLNTNPSESQDATLSDFATFKPPQFTGKSTLPFYVPHPLVSSDNSATHPPSDLTSFSSFDRGCVQDPAQNAEEFKRRQLWDLQVQMLAIQAELDTLS